jgi:hypothetical protein
MSYSFEPRDYSVSELMPLLRMGRRQILWRIHRAEVPVRHGKQRAFLVNPHELVLLSMWRNLPITEETELV